MQIVTVTFRLTLVTFGKLIDSAKEEVIHAKVVSAKEEVATSEEVPPIHAVKPSPVAVLRGRQRQP